MVNSVFFVMIGGAVGSALRYLLGSLISVQAGGLPVATLLINVLGSFVLGMISAAASRTDLISPRMALLLGTGLCGGFTTFSTFSVELTTLAELGQYGTLLAYAVASTLGGIVAALLGIGLVTSLTR